MDKMFFNKLKIANVGKMLLNTAGINKCSPLEYLGFITPPHRWLFSNNNTPSIVLFLLIISIMGIKWMNNAIFMHADLQLDGQHGGRSSQFDFQSADRKFLREPSYVCAKGEDKMNSQVWMFITLTWKKCLWILGMCYSINYSGYAFSLAQVEATDLQSGLMLEYTLESGYQPPPLCGWLTRWVTQWDCPNNNVYDYRKACYFIIDDKLLHLDPISMY